MHALTPLAVDTESSGLYPDDGARVCVVSWAQRTPAGDIEAGALPFGQGPPPNLLDSPQDAGAGAWAALLDRLAGSSLVFHNAAHDLHMLAAGALPGHVGRHLIDALAWDTQLVQRRLDPLDPVGLEPSCVRLLGVQPWKAQLAAWLDRTKPKRRFDLLPWSVIEPYATEDAVNTLLLYEHQRERVEALPDAELDDTVAALARDRDVCRALYWMEVRGVGFDRATCLRAAAELRERLAKADAALPPELHNPTPARICAYYYDQLGYAPTKTDKQTGRPVRSADELSRRGLADQGAPHIAELEVWAEIETALTSWYQGWPMLVGDDGRLRMRVRQTKVTSGRLSGERVNLLAIPHDHMLPAGLPTLRSMIQPAPGLALYEIDLSQAEVRVGAVAARCEPLKAAYRAGHDVYEVAAREVFNVTRASDEFDHYRSLCKRIVLSSIYAAGAKTLVRTCKQFMGIDLRESEAQRFLERFRTQYPEFKRAERRCAAFVERHGYIPLALGERRYFNLPNLGRPAPWEESYKALNQRIQGSVGVAMKECMIEVEREHWGVMLLQTHDSLLIETDDDAQPRAVADIMERTFTRIFGLPFVAEIKAWI